MRKINMILRIRSSLLLFSGDIDNDGNIDADHSRYNEELSKQIKDNLIGTSILLQTRGRILEGVIRSKK